MAIKTIIIHPGESVTLPIGTKIDSLIINGSISVTSTCADLPTPTAQKCYKMEWSASANASPNYTLEHNEALIKYMNIGGVKYTIGLDPTDPGGVLTLAFMNIAAQLPGIFDFESLQTVGLANRSDSILLFRSIPSVADTIEVNMTGDGFPVNGLFIKPYESTDCVES